MMPPLRLALFDVDGVLLDSLSQHLRICRDKAREYGLHLRIPSPVELKHMIRRGVRVSPMDAFFRAVGFPEALAQRAYQEYQLTFMRDYAPRPFPGTLEALEKIDETGLTLGIVSSNFRANIGAALRDAMRYFEESCIFTKDTPEGASKERAIREAIRICAISSPQAIYIGDQWVDWHAAEAAGAYFLGVSYGWGISMEDDKEFPVAANIGEVAAYLRSRRPH